MDVLGIEETKISSLGCYISEFPKIYRPEVTPGLTFSIHQTIKNSEGIYILLQLTVLFKQ